MSQSHRARVSTLLPVSRLHVADFPANLCYLQVLLCCSLFVFVFALFLAGWVTWFWLVHTGFLRVMFASNKLLAALCASPYKLTDQTLRWFLSEMFQCKRRMILPILQLVLQHAKISNMSFFLPRMCPLQVICNCLIYCIYIYTYIYICICTVLHIDSVQALALKRKACSLQILQGASDSVAWVLLQGKAQCGCVWK